MIRERTDTHRLRSSPPVSLPCQGRDRREAPGIGLDASIVIPTYKRDEQLRALLEKLCALDYAHDRFEIIVVDDARSETTGPIISSVAALHPDVAIRLLPGRSRGPATARNIGWRAARGAVIAFIDDDAYPADDQWLANGLAALADPALAGASGQVVVPIDGTPTDFQRNVEQLQGRQHLTCNAFYRRAALEAVGGFDERFTVPFREDSDLAFRVEDKWGPLATAPDAVVIHPAPRGRFAVSLRLQRYSMFNALMYKKHSRRYRHELQRLPPLHYYAMLGCLAGAFAYWLSGRGRAATVLLACWSLLEGRFFASRARGASREPRHLLDLALTSLLIPPLSVYWRLRGAVRFRVLFF